MTKVSRAILKTSAASRFPDQNDEAITPEDSRSQAVDEADSLFNLIDDDFFLHLYHSSIRPYKTGDVIYKNGDFLESKTDHSGAFDITNWTFIPEIPDWITGKDYYVKKHINVSNVIYRCKVDHTSGVFATDLAAGNWEATGDANTFSFNLTSTGPIGHTFKITVDDNGTVSGEDIGLIAAEAFKILTSTGPIGHTFKITVDDNGTVSAEDIG